MIELAYRVACDGKYCNTMTRFTHDRAEALRDAKADGYARVRVVYADGKVGRPMLCSECRARVGGTK